MRAIIPQQLTILETTAVAEDYPLWDQDTAYAEGDTVIDKNYIFTAVKDVPAGERRPFDDHDTSTANWRKKGATNPYRCVDDALYTQTVAGEGETDLSITVPFTRPATGYGLVNVEADSVTVTLKDANGNVIWGGTEQKLREPTFGMFAYLNDPFRLMTISYATGLPHGNARLTVDLHGARPAIGMIVAGEVVSLGNTTYGAGFGFKDYSISTTDEFGHPYYVERKKADLLTAEVNIRRKELYYVKARVKDIGKRPTLWLGDDGAGDQVLTVFGRLREFDGTLAAWAIGGATFDIEGFVQ